MVKRATLALLLFTLAAPVLAESDPAGWAYDLSAELMSPFCPGRTLSDCPSQAAKSLVMWVVVQEAAGRTRSDVEEELIARYGEVMRPAPKAEGIGLTAYLVPAVTFAGGGILIGLFLRRQTRSAPQEPDPLPVDPELERIVDEEIDRS